MHSLRKWLYRPRRDDKSLLAKFWYADDNLNRVAAELDSFDGRKDPERCAALVSKLRSCQDKLLNICNRMLDELEGPGNRASREFRQKFPDEIVTDNLGGQLWFGAECLAAGSSIMNKEFESEQMRPLAKAVTKTLEKVRSYLREQCLSPTPHYTEEIHENLKIFDRLFSEFEFAYVSCMVHVKTTKEFEIQQDVICLFSDTLQRAIQKDMISQEMVDLYDPSLMFAIPRLAIVCGLLIFPNGPLNVERDNSDFPELFRPFKNLLRKIRDLLLTLSPAEFFVLERLLCQLEEPSDLERKLKAAELELEEKSRQMAGEDQAAKLDEKLSSVMNITDCDDKTHTAAETSAAVESLLNDILNDVISQACTKESNDRTEGGSKESTDRRESGSKESTDRRESGSKESIERRESGSSGGSKVPVVEIDCTGPDITVSPVGPCEDTSSSPGRRRQRIRVVDPETGQIKHKSKKRKERRKYPRSGKDARARFKSSEDLIHRLYVCISGAADQLQTNFAGDFRSILKYVFVMNGSPEEEEEEEEEDIPETDEKSQDSVSDHEEEEELSPDSVSLHNDTPETSGAEAARPVMIAGGPRSRGQYECGEDALMQETEQEYLRSMDNPRQEQEYLRSMDPRLLSTSPPALLTSMPVYASNLDYHMTAGQETSHDIVLGSGDTDTAAGQFYQPEPALLTIASGHPGPVAPLEEQEQGRSRRVEAPPAWIPDSMAPLCMGCGATFSLVKRRHHCRSCGRVFCAKCSPNQVPLPRYGIQKAVRVCNRCYIYYMNPYEERTAHAYHVYSGTGHGSWGYSGMVS